MSNVDWSTEDGYTPRVLREASEAEAFKVSTADLGYDGPSPRHRAGRRA